VRAVTRIRHDYHTHSTYSDGSFLWSMVGAAAEAGLDGIGITDHCNVSAGADHDRRKKVMGFNLDQTFERRREGIEAVRERFDVDVHDAVEMDYEPDDEAAVADFLETADFDYAIGSVHYLDGVNVHFGSYFAEKSGAERRELVDRYFEKLVALVESELFEIAAHPDLFERTPELRGLATDDHYHAVAEAFRSSRTVPELNAGRALDTYGEFHPAPRFIEVLLDHDVRFTIGTDSHDPGEIEPRMEAMEELCERHGIDPELF
jgi:histidinol-phosphatase (PHP family)